MTPQSSDNRRRLESLISEAEVELARLQSEVKEIRILHKQNSEEAEAMADKDARAAKHLSLMEANLEQYSRQDLRDAYRPALEARLRLFMLRNQVEQLQYKLEQLDRYSHLLGRVIELRPYADQPVGESEKRAPVLTVARVIEAQEKERRLLARQIHDGPAQSLTNLILQAEICERLFDSDPARARKELAALKATITSTFQQLREFIFDLRPMMLDDLGLLPTLRQYLGDFGKKTGLSVSFSLLGEERRLPPHSEASLFRLVQRITRNIHDHAGARQVRVTLDLRREGATVTIEDDGRGSDPQSDPEATLSAREKGHQSIRNQVTLMGSTISIERCVNRGTRIVLAVPED